MPALEVFIRELFCCITKFLPGLYVTKGLFSFIPKTKDLVFRWKGRVKQRLTLWSVWDLAREDREGIKVPVLTVYYSFLFKHLLPCLPRPTHSLNFSFTSPAILSQSSLPGPPLTKPEMLEGPGLSPRCLRSPHTVILFFLHITAVTATFLALASGFFLNSRLI